VDRGGGGGELHGLIIRLSPAGQADAAAPRGLPSRARTSYRDIFLLACCQALLLTNASGLITMNGLVGFSLAEHKTLATLGATTYVLGSALSTMPLSLGWRASAGAGDS